MKAEWHLLYGGDRYTEDFLDDKWSEIKVPITSDRAIDLEVWQWLDTRASLFQTYRIAGCRCRSVKTTPHLKYYTEPNLVFWVEFKDPELALLFKLIYGGT